MSADRWFYIDGAGTQFGPATAADVREALAPRQAGGRQPAGPHAIAHGCRIHRADLRARRIDVVPARCR